MKFVSFFNLLSVAVSIVPVQVRPTRSRVPILEASFDILDYDIRFECPVVISTSCSSGNVLEKTFVVHGDSLLPIETARIDKEGLAATGWVTVGDLSFAAVLTRNICPGGVTTVCIGPSSDLSLENSKFGLTRDGLIPESRFVHEDLEYVPAVGSRNGWAFVTKFVQFGHQRIHDMEIAINTDQTSPIAMSDKTLGLLFGEEVRESLIMPGRFYKIASHRKTPLLIRNLQFELNLTLGDGGLWVDVITDPKDSRYNQIGLGYDLIENLDIYLDSENSRIGLRASV